MMRELSSKRTISGWPVALFVLAGFIIIQIINFKKREDFAVLGIAILLFIIFFYKFPSMRAISYDETAVYAFGFLQNDIVPYTQIGRFKRDFTSNSD
jgi:uncharacterized membrane protein